MRLVNGRNDSHRAASHVHAEHRAIMEATLARDPDRACAEITDHILRTINVVDSLELQGQMGAPAAGAFGGE